MIRKILGSLYLVIAGLILFNEETSLFQEDAWSGFSTSGIFGIIWLLGYLIVIGLLIFFGVKLITSTTSVSSTTSVHWLAWVPLAIILGSIAIFGIVWFFACQSNQMFCAMQFV